jgi:acetyltransferase
MAARLASLLAPRRVVFIHPQGTALPDTPSTRVQVHHLQLNAAGEFTAPPERFDLAVVLVPEDAVLATLRQLCTTPLAPAVVIPGQTGQEVADAAATLAAAAGLILLGPHAFGLQLPALGINASASPLARPGRIALLSQSSSLTSAMMDWAADHHVGFSLAASCGAYGAASLVNLLDYCATDSGTDAVVVYLDEVAPGHLQTRRFMSALRAAASAKPVVVLKPTGRSALAANPSGRSVTLANEEAVFSAALARAGAVRVYFFIQLFSALKLLTGVRRPAGRRLCVLSNSSAAARLAAEWAQRVRVAVDIEDLQGPTQTWAQQTAQLAAAPRVDALMLMLTPHPDLQLAVASALAQALATSGKPVQACVLGDAQARGLRRAFEAVQVPAFRTPEAAVDAFGNLATFYYNQELLRQIPPPASGITRSDLNKARPLIGQWQASDIQVLDGVQAQALLRTLGIARTLALYATAAQDGDTLLPTIELHVTGRTHPQFGPVLLFGLGGSAGALIVEQVYELAPLNRLLAQRLIERSRAYTALANLPQAEMVLLQLQNLLLTLSNALSELPALLHIMLNPVRLRAGQLRITNAQIHLAKADPCAQHMQAYAHMAIHPYPAMLESTAVLRSPDQTAKAYTLRPIRPEDATLLQAFVRGLSSQSRYMRFISHLQELPAQMLVRYTQIDYDRELALVAVLPATQPQEAECMIGMAHWLRGNDAAHVEYALAVADGYQRQGIGSTLMRALELQARAHAVEMLEGFVLADNTAMLQLMRHLGYTVAPMTDDPNLRRVYKLLS